MRNRSIPAPSVIPELAYDDAAVAADWLCRAFGFRVRLRIATHRVQLTFGSGALVVSDGAAPKSDAASHRTLVRVEDADRHHQRAAAAGARILSPPIDQPFGERQYNAEDFAGHRWTFSQTIADVDPASWGGTVVELD